jgi:hypothetical protein
MRYNAMEDKYYELDYDKNKLGGGYTPTPANIETPPG